MSLTVGDFIVERLHQWRMRRIFGYPGDGINAEYGGMLHIASAWDMAFGYLRTLVKVDPDEWKIIKHSAKQLLPFWS